jgi:hypothetical protein
VESPATGFAARGTRLRGLVAASDVCAKASAAFAGSLVVAVVDVRGVRGFGGALGNVASASAALPRLRGLAADGGIPSASLPGASVFLLMARV